ncbi:MAG: protein phosphatase 2C domain-containing protein [Planctomycetes bacterium]|nr:protein phosphatase 2C domain-containing protein [Planctomycetota bacterium]
MAWKLTVYNLADNAREMPLNINTVSRQSIFESSVLVKDKIKTYFPDTIWADENHGACSKPGLKIEISISPSLKCLDLDIAGTIDPLYDLSLACSKESWCLFDLSKGSFIDIQYVLQSRKSIDVYVGSEKSGEENEDRVGYIRMEKGMLIILADGAGGTSGGAEAAQFAVDSIKSKEFNYTDLYDPWRLCGILYELDREVACKRDLGECTGVLAYATQDKIYGASVGDSEAWLVGAEEVTRLTQNQNRKPLLGSGEIRATPFGPVPFSEKLILGSDGLFKYAKEYALLDEIRNSSVETCPARLIDCARMKSGKLQDDTTVVVAINS